jgi:hypothetical protein
MASRIPFFGFSLIVLTLLLFAGSAGAQDVSPRCAAAMDRAAAHYSKCLLFADASYARHANLSKLEDRQVRCDARFDRHTTRAIRKHGTEACPSADRVAAMAARTVSYAEDAASEAHGGEGGVIQDLMIEQSVRFTRNILDQFLKEQFFLPSDVVVTNDVVDPDGAVPVENQNKVVISIIHIGRSSIGLLMTSQFDDYRESLKFIDSIIAFFQENADVDSLNHPDMPAGIDKMEFHFRELDSADLFDLWGALGARYRPSAVYNLKLFDMNEG